MLKAEGERVYIEYCRDCARHQWCTKHVEEKYSSYYNSCRAEILDLTPDVSVRSNEVPPALRSKFSDDGAGGLPSIGKLTFPRIGAFEVFLRGKFIFSKLESGHWPHPAAIAAKVREVLEQLRLPPTIQESRVRTVKKKKRKGKKKSKKPGRSANTSTPLTDQKRNKDVSYVEGDSASVRRVSHTNRSLHDVTPANEISKSVVQQRTPDLVSKETRKPAQLLKEDVFEPEKYDAESASDHSNHRQLPQAQDTEGYESDHFSGGPPQDDDDIDAVGKADEYEREHQIQPEAREYEEPEDPKAEVLAAYESDHFDEQKTDPKPEEEDDNQDYEDRFDDQEFEDKEEPQSDSQKPDEDPQHPIREVTKEFELKLKVGVDSNKKITYENKSTTAAVFYLTSSNTDVMEIKEPEVAIEGSGKGKFQLKFNAVDSAQEVTVYLYVDQDEAPIECIEIHANFED